MKEVIDCISETRKFDEQRITLAWLLLTDWSIVLSIKIQYRFQTLIQTGVGVEEVQRDAMALMNTVFAQDVINPSLRFWMSNSSQLLRTGSSPQSPGCRFEPSLAAPP